MLVCYVVCGRDVSLWRERVLGLRFGRKVWGGGKRRENVPGKITPSEDER